MNKILQLALDRKSTDGNLLSIFDVKTGKECFCYCPECLELLEAKNNNKFADKPLLNREKTAHFAHFDGSMCSTAPETAIHLLAKKVLQETMSLFIPSLNHLGLEVWTGKKILFDKVETEKIKQTGGITIKPDIILMKDNKELFVEFYKSHKVDYVKIEKIKEFNTSCIEININLIEPLVNGKPNIVALKKIFENQSHLKTWLFNSEVESLYLNKMISIEAEKRSLEERAIKKIEQKTIEKSKLAEKSEIFKNELLAKGYEFQKVYDYPKFDYDYYSNEHSGHSRIYKTFSSKNESVYCPKQKENGKNKRIDLSECENCKYHLKIIYEENYVRKIACGYKNNLMYTKQDK